jgi:hypothetical protein
MEPQSKTNNYTHKAKARNANFVGIFIALIGLVLLAVWPAGYIESLSESVLPGNKSGIASALVGGLVGLFLFALGSWMILLRRKITPQDLPEKTNLSLYVTHLPKSGPAATTQQTVTLSPEGIRLTNTPHAPTIAWADIQRTSWRSIYQHGGYSVVTKTHGAYVFLALDPIEARAKARSYWVRRLLLPSNIGKAYGTTIVIRNEKHDAAGLGSFHQYVRAYSGRAASRWSGLFEQQLLVAFFLAAPVTVLTTWLYSYRFAFVSKSEAVDVMWIALLGGLALLFALMLREFILSRKVAASITTPTHPS